MHEDDKPDTTEARRRARFGALPERISPEDMVEEQPALPKDPSRDHYDPDEVAVRYQTLAQCSTLQGGGVGHPRPSGP